MNSLESKNPAELNYYQTTSKQILQKLNKNTQIAIPHPNNRMNDLVHRSQSVLKQIGPIKFDRVNSLQSASRNHMKLPAVFWTEKPKLVVAAQFCVSVHRIVTPSIIPIGIVIQLSLIRAV